MAISVKGAHFPQDLMRMGVRWYLTSPLRYRHGEARMTECGVRLDHATIQRGVVQDSPLLEEAWHRRAVYLHPADKYYRLTRRPSQGQKGLDERAIMASQWPSHPW
jgi:putative transposase